MPNAPSPRIAPIHVVALAGALAAVPVALWGGARSAVWFLTFAVVSLAACRLALEPERTIRARSRAFDVTVLVLFAIALAYLSFAPQL